MKKIFIVGKKDNWARKMEDKYGIPAKALKRILKRDKLCVYCHKRMILPRKETKQRNWATVEHMNDEPPWNNPITISLCCGSCNSSRRMGFKRWFKTQYCLDKGINEKTVAKPVKDYIKMLRRLSPENRKKFFDQNY